MWYHLQSNQGRDEKFDDVGEHRKGREILKQSSISQKSSTNSRDITMADVISSMDAVYAKWEKKATANGSGPQTNGAQQAVDNGRRAWKQKFKELPPQPERRSRNTRYSNSGANRSQSYKMPLTAMIGDFKRTPSVNIMESRFTRPITNRCCKCMPISRDTFTHESPTGMPHMTNVLRLPQLTYTLLSIFSNITYTYRHTVRFGYPNITESVLRSHRSQIAVERTVQELLEQQELPLDENSKEYKKQKKKCEGKLKKMFNKMKAVMSIPIFKVTGWFLNNVLGSLLNAIQVHNSHLHALKDASLSGKPVIYLPMHRSHLDYVLITYILWHFGIRAPYVAAGDNLNIFSFGQILRSLGGFFIRRRMDKEAGKKDHLYRAVLSEYVEELLRRGQSLEFFVEGGRSRSGKPYYPKAGLLSMVVDWVLASRNETDGILQLDALIVPVSISYEKIMDGNFTREQMGMPKKPESFWATVKAIWKLFSTTFGNVRVDFCQPFSLKEYLTVNQASLASVRGDSPITVPGMPHIRDSMSDLQAINTEQHEEPVLLRSGSDNSIYGIDVSKDEEKLVIDALAKHVVYNSMCSAAIMSTNIVAFHFLYNHRKGASLPELMTSLDSLRDLILVSGRDLGFVGKSSDIIAHACRLLGPALLDVTVDGSQGSWCDLYDSERFADIVITPSVGLPHIIELYYYASPVLTVFHLRSLIACAMCASSGCPILDDSVDKESVSFTKESVLAYALYLADLFKYEYLFSAPCKSLENELGDVFESLISSEMIVSPDVEDTYNEEAQQWTSRIVRRTMYGLHEDDMEDYFVPDKEFKLRADEVPQFRMYATMMQPLIESYWVSACHLEKLLPADKPLSDLTTEIHTNLISRVEQGVTAYSESVTQDLVKNSLKSFADHKIVDMYDVASVRMVSLSDQYNTAEKIHELVSRIDSFRSN